MDTKVTVAGAIGAGVGALQTPVLRQFVDKKYPLTNIPSLKGFGTPSALFGLIGGGVGLTVGAVGLSKKDGRQRLKDEYVEPAIDYGITAIVGGILSGLYPAVTEADCVAKGGYWYDGACHKTPAAGTVSMQGAPQVQTSAYRSPASVQQPAVDINLLKQMSAELQRLGNENATLRAEVQQLGTVAAKQAQYGFMNPGLVPSRLEPGGALVPANLQPIAPGQPTRRAEEFGFMQPGIPTPRTRRFGFMDDGSGQPVSKMQSIAGRYDFSG